jgi:hypothetical protein
MLFGVEYSLKTEGKRNYLLLVARAQAWEVRKWELPARTVDCTRYVAVLQTVRIGRYLCKRLFLFLLSF